MTQIKELKVESHINKKSQQENQDLRKKCDKELLEKDYEILCLRDHSQNLLAQIRKSKDKKQGDQMLE